MTKSIIPSIIYMGGREAKTFLEATYRFDAYMLACFIGNNRCTDT